MDRLSEKQREAIKRMTDTRLIAKLVKAGYTIEQVEAMDRKTLMETWAECVATGNDKPVAEAATGGGTGYDPEIERQRLEFERNRFEWEKMKREEEKAERVKQEEKAERLRLEAERLRQEEKAETDRLRQAEEEKAERLRQEVERLRQEEEAKAERLRAEEKAETERIREEERQEREREFQLRKLQLENQQEELAMRRQQAALAAARAATDRERFENPAAKAKMYGDAIRNTATKQPNDPAELSSFFEQFERLFADYAVPADLQLQLIKPYLSDRSRTAMTRHGEDKITRYGELKRFLLAEYKCVPQYYLERFNTLNKGDNETVVSFMGRLKTMLRYYLNSRHIADSFEALYELLICDRIKTVLSEGCLRHILSVEATSTEGWVRTEKLAEIADLYLASYDKHNRPRTGVINRAGDVPAKRTPPPATSVVVSSTSPAMAPPPPITSVASGVTTPAGPPPKKCFKCHSSQHLYASCPRRSPSDRQTEGRSARTPVVNRCAVEPSGTNVGQETTPVGPEKPRTVAVTLEIENGTAADIPTPTACIYDVITAPLECTGVHELSKPPELAELQYVKVQFNEAPGVVVTGIADSGAEMPVIDSAILNDYIDNIPVVGTVKLRGLFGQPVTAKVIQLNIAPEGAKQDGYIPILCAVCDEVNEPLILSTNVTCRLFDCMHSKVLNTLVQNEMSAANNSPQVLSVVPNEIDVSHVRPIDREESICVDSPPDNAELVDCDAAGDIPTETGVATSSELRREQTNDDTLKPCWILARAGRAGYFIDDGLLYRHETIYGQKIRLLCVPIGRRRQVLRLAHDIAGAHLASRKTRDRIRISGLTWPSITADVTDYCGRCKQCQLRARVTYHDRVPITAIPRCDEIFAHWFMDCLGPIFPNVPNVDMNYCLILVDSCSRYPAAYPMRSLTAKNVCQALLLLFMQTGLASTVTISSDNASNFTASLTREFLQRLGCSPRFATPQHPNSCGLVERAVGTVKNSISKLAHEHPRQWHKYLPFVLWALREVPNETTNCPPFLLVYGKLPRGPLAILKDNWEGRRDLPLSLGKSADEFLSDLRSRLQVAKDYAEGHANEAQRRYVTHYNLRSRDKHFTVGEQCLILSPDSTASKVFSRWKGPATVVEVCSPHSYMVEYHGARSLLHANKLRKFRVGIDEAACNVVHVCDEMAVSSCAIVYEKDEDFGRLEFIDVNANKAVESGGVMQPPPSQKIDPSRLSHLSPQQRDELCAVLDRYPKCFSDVPGFYPDVQHDIQLYPGFVPKRLKEYNIPLKLRPEVDRQIAELLELGIIVPSNSPMASPVVCVLKPEGGVRIAINYCYLNSHTVPDQMPVPRIADVIQRIGQANYISVFDAKAGYHQCGLRSEQQWLSGFVANGNLYQYTRVPFGMRNSGCTFIRALHGILLPVKDFTEAYVDDMAVYSSQWSEHLDHLERYLKTIESSGLTLNLAKCKFGLPEVRFVGHVIGSGRRRADPAKVEAIQSLKPPETKRQVRQILGMFSYFQEYIPRYADIAKPITDLTSKRIPNRIPWGQSQQLAFETLKDMLCKAVLNPLHIIDLSMPFNLYVDSSDYATGALLTQPTPDGMEQPVAMASSKLTNTQRNWAVIEKEAYAAIWALNRFKHWIFAAKVILYSDHNPLTYLTVASPKSAKLTRWMLALQEFQVDFRFRKGTLNGVADCFSRMVYPPTATGEGQSIEGKPPGSPSDD